MAMAMLLTSASNPKFALLFLFLVSFYFIKILSRSYGYACKFCFVEENNIPKNTDTNLELNALVKNTAKNSSTKLGTQNARSIFCL
jgi:hypothetical protein